jgi:NAD(P) transhydrogenase subunit beta
MTEILIQLAYLFAAFLFITALRALGRPDSARRGMQFAAFGMAVAVVATLFHSVSSPMNGSSSARLWVR